LLVGFYEGKSFKFAGRVGTGFSEKLLGSLFDDLQKIRIANCPFNNLPAPGRNRWDQGLTAAEMRRCRWAKPTMVCQVKFTEWTRDNRLRQPVFLGLREDKRVRSRLFGSTSGLRCDNLAQCLLSQGLSQELITTILHSWVFQQTVWARLKPGWRGGLL
jgi:bifunctional non-homologous end joining protein LigD